VTLEVVTAGTETVMGGIDGTEGPGSAGTTIGGVGDAGGVGAGGLLSGGVWGPDAMDSGALAVAPPDPLGVPTGEAPGCSAVRGAEGVLRLTGGSWETGRLATPDPASARPASLLGAAPTVAGA
jgi:hypothetical protein